MVSLITLAPTKINKERKEKGLNNGALWKVRLVKELAGCLTNINEPANMSNSSPAFIAQIAYTYSKTYIHALTLVYKLVYVL